MTLLPLLAALSLSASAPPAAPAPPQHAAVLFVGHSGGDAAEAGPVTSASVGVFRELGGAWSTGPEAGYYRLGTHAAALQLAWHFRARRAQGLVRPYALVGPAFELLTGTRPSDVMALGLSGGLGLELHPHAGPVGYLLGARAHAGIAPGAYDSPQLLYVYALQIGISFR